MKTTITLLCMAAAAIAYEGKYADDPRLARIRKELPARYAKARAKVAAALSHEVPAFPIVLEDAGRDRSGVMAETRDGPVIVLKTEYLVLDAHDLDKTLVHELVHCMQRKLGGHDKLPTWAREGMALHVAGQTKERAELLAIVMVVDEFRQDPVEALVDGLAGPHDFHDYAEDGYAFEVLAEHVGATALPSLLFRLARDGLSALPIAVERLDRLARERARARLRVLVAAVPPKLRGLARAEAHARGGRLDEARTAWRDHPLPPRALLGRRLLLELRLVPDERFAAAAALARKDLEPFPEWEQALAISARRGGRSKPSPSREAR